MLNENFNKDIEMGGFRPVDLTVPPFNLKNAENIVGYGNDEIGKKKVYLYVNPKLLMRMKRLLMRMRYLL